MKEKKTAKVIVSNFMYYFSRIGILLATAMMFFPGINPARVSILINKNMSLFTSGTGYASLVAESFRPFNKGWVQESSFILLFISSMIICIGIVIAGVGGCMSVGNVRYKRLGNKFSLGGSLLQLSGLVGIYISYTQINQTSNPAKVGPMFPTGIYFFLVIAVVIFISSIVNQILLPKITKETKFEMESKFKLFLMFLPFIILVFVFSYLPLWGWRYAFFDYKSGGTLGADNFVGFKWFTYLFQNDATLRDIARVMKNTLAMSGLGLATSWVSMAFAIFLSEIKNSHYKRFVQIFSTIPNFISWVLVYAIALAIFSTDGFLNSILINVGAVETPTNYLMGDSYIWLKMLAWGMWKGLGWSAIIYIAAISGIDQQLYEAATVDGAGRFQKMWHITLPGLVPTFFVLFIMSVAGILTNGMDQYLVFKNPTNIGPITVLDLYVYQLGIDSGVIPLSTVVGMVKSLISVLLLFAANNASKLIRGNSIV